MGQIGVQEWPGAWSAQVGNRIRSARQAAGLSAQKVSDRCEDLGFPIPRSTIANIESGRKEALPIHEISVLAAALELPPAALLFPVDEAAQIEVLPGVAKNPFAAWCWFTEGAVGFGVLANSDRSSSPTYTDFVEALVANARIRSFESSWMIQQGLIQKMEALAADDDPAGSSEMQAAVEATKTRQAREAREASEHFRSLAAKGLPTPDLPPEFEAAILAQMEQNSDA